MFSPREIFSAFKVENVLSLGTLLSFESWNLWADMVDKFSEGEAILL